MPFLLTYGFVCVFQLKCCGAVGPSDYYYSVWYNHTDHTSGGFVPDSCCHALKAAKKDCQRVAIDEVIGPIYKDSKQTTQVGTAFLLLAF